MLARVNCLICCALLALSACAAVRPGPAPEQVPLVEAPAGRHAVTALPLTVAGPAEGQGRAYFDAEGAGRVTVSFLAHGPGAYAVRAICDGRARVQRAGEGLAVPAWVPALNAVVLRVEPGERRRSGLELDPRTQACDLIVTPGGRPPWSLRLLRSDTALPRVAALDAPVETCAGGGRDALERAFMASGNLSATCPMPAGPMLFLPDGIDALNARIEALTGSALPRGALETADPDMPLDFSQAPELDLIYLTYLNLNADFVGYLTARMLAFHAARGTIVRILVSDVMFTDADRRLFEGLAAQYPTVQIQPYRMPPGIARGLEGQVARLHRVNHVKLFATVARVPGRSIAILGGRNMHEGYFFAEPRDLSAFPFLQQYNPDRLRIVGGFTAYEDFELGFRRDAQVQHIVRHMSMLWHRDHDTQDLRPPAGTATASPSEGDMRHFLSVPFTDGAAMETYFAGLIDAAERRIRIASPYLNLPPEVEAAMLRARGRGVQVDVVATVRVREATDFMVTGFNRRFANRHAGWLAFYDHDPMPLLMHTKLIVIDDRLVIAGSVNLNRRSFLHDPENGVLVLDRGLAAQADRLIQSYIDQGERMAPGQEMSGWMRFLSGFGFVERMF
ncbi:MAG: phospholipase D-like domain-containing protein [Pararhodobacter sp.]